MPILKLDQLLTEFFFNILPHNTFFDYFFLFLSAVGSMALIWIIIVLIIVIYEQERHPKFIFVFFTGLVFITLVVNLGFKNIIRRERPTNSLWLNNTKIQKAWSYFPELLPTDYSFPSSHASSSFFAAAVFSYYYSKNKKKKKTTNKPIPNWPLFYYSMAVLISYSRIYLGVHFFTDIAAGAIIGISLAMLLTKQFNKT
jgi:undecaprenyl-diphosphatase